jgi:hypothetical protein
VRDGLVAVPGRESIPIATVAAPERTSEDVISKGFAPAHEFTILNI